MSSRWTAVWLSALACGCLEPTQVELSISTNMPCGDLDSVGIFVGEPDRVERELPDTSARGTCTAGRVGTIMLVPADADDAKFGIKLVAGVKTDFNECQPPNYRTDDTETGCVVARRALGFVPQTPLELPVSLDEQCIERFCGPDATCVQGECRDRWVAVDRDCEGGVCTEEQLPSCNVETDCPGDANGDGHVGLGDITLIAGLLGTRCGEPNYDPRADVTEDQVIDGFDLHLANVADGCSCASYCPCPIVHPCPGDANGDGMIDDADLYLWDRAKFTSCGDERYLPTADFNADSVVDVADWQIWNASRSTASACGQ